MPTIHVTRIIEDVDFRGYKKLLARLSGRIKSGEAVVVFNRQKTRARLFDCAGGIYYMPSAPEGEEFDLKVVGSMLRTGLFVSLSYLQRSKKKAA